MDSIIDSTTSDALLQFQESYRQVEWQTLLKQAQHSLNIAVYYWDKWIQEHEALLVGFLQKPKAKIQFFFSSHLDQVQQLFPNNTVDQLSEKIRKTYQPLQTFLKTHHLPMDKVSVRFLPRLLNYSMQCIDDKILVLSFFEMFRKEQVDSPVIVVDLKKSPHLRKFYEKELKGFIKEGISR